MDLIYYGIPMNIWGCHSGGAKPQERGYKNYLCPNTLRQLQVKIMSLSIRWSTVYAQQDLPFMRLIFQIAKLEAKVKSSTVYARITQFIHSGL